MEKSREMLLLEIKNLKKRKKYGLVWENNPEDIADLCKIKLPVLRENKSKEINPKSHSKNILIEGDNYHALSVLNYTHKGKIDVIYIDPPYNNGKKSWKYNNRFIDKNDSYKHSKWLSFMSKRLKLAKKLLKKKGVLICAIDHNEQERLGLLFDEIFPAYEKTCITIINNPSGQQSQNFSYIHDYAYFIYPKGEKSIQFEMREDNPDIRNFRDVTGEDSLRKAAKNCFYPIYIQNKEIIGFGDVCEDTYHPASINILNDDIIEIYPIDPNGIERKWRYARQTVESIKNELKPFFLDHRKIWDIKRTKKYFPYKTVWTDKKYNSNNYGTQFLNNIIETSFPYPKSPYTVQDTIKACVHSKEDAIILDFFAGSGTTGQSVLELNKEDKGNRKFILCTNNENNICTDVCYPRLKKIIKGYKNSKNEKIEGLTGNLKYFKTDFIDYTATDANKKKLVDNATELLCIKEDCFDELRTSEYYDIFKNKEKYMAVIYGDEGIEPFKKIIKKLKICIRVYVFSLDDYNKEEEFEDVIDQVHLKPIPIDILNTYRRIFQ